VRFVRLTDGGLPVWVNPAAVATIHPIGRSNSGLYLLVANPDPRAGSPLLEVRVDEPPEVVVALLNGDGPGHGSGAAG
jgi:hypothetical protein